MVEIIKDYAKVEQLMCFVSDSQKFARPKDKLTALIDKYTYARTITRKCLPDK